MLGAHTMEKLCARRAADFSEFIAEIVKDHLGTPAPPWLKKLLPEQTFLEKFLSSIWPRGNNLNLVKAVAPTQVALAKIFTSARAEICALALVVLICGCNKPVDEAKAAGLTIVDFPQITADVFRAMDGGIGLSLAEIMGRNAWNLCSAGNQRFWNAAAQDSFGLMDLLKILDNLNYPRGERFAFSVWPMNRVSAPHRSRTSLGFGSTKTSNLSRRASMRRFMAHLPVCSDSDCSPIGSSTRQRATNGMATVSCATQVIPTTTRLIRPHRVGAACGSCHIPPNISNSPADPENPRWKNLASAIGNQYINEGKIFGCNRKGRILF
jgi:hypothetical protein